MRNNRSRKMVAILATLALAHVMALAQGGPPQGQRGPGGPGGPGMMAGPAILLRPDVQRELKLSSQQIESIQKILPQRRGEGGPPEGGQRGQGNFQRGQGGQQGFQGGPPRRENGEQVEMLDKQVKAVLTEAQYKRYHELDLQLAGASAVLRRDIADQLKITDQQREAIMQAMRPDGRGREFQGGQGQRGQGGPPDRDQMEQMRKDRDAKVLGLLTEAQRALWTKMLGKKFEFERQGPPPAAR